MTQTTSIASETDTILGDNRFKMLVKKKGYRGILDKMLYWRVF